MAPPRCSRASVRLVAILLAVSVASAAVLPHAQYEHHQDKEVTLFPRDASAADVPVTLVSDPEPKNFLDDLLEFLRRYSAKDILRYLFGNLVDGDVVKTTTSIIPVTAIQQTSSLESAQITVVGLPVTTILVIATPASSSSSISGAQVFTDSTRSIESPGPTIEPGSVTIDSKTVVTTASSIPESILAEIPRVSATSSIPESTLAEISGLPASYSNISTTSSLPMFSILPFPPFPPKPTYKFKNSTTASGRYQPTSGGGSIHILPFPYPLPTGFWTTRKNSTIKTGPTSAAGTGSVGAGTAISVLGLNENTTTHIRQTSTLFITQTVIPFLATGTSISGTDASNIPFALNTTARWMNTIYTPSFETGTVSAAGLSTPTSGFFTAGTNTAPYGPTDIPPYPPYPYTLAPPPGPTTWPIFTPLPLPTPYINTSSTDTLPYTGGPSRLSELCALSTPPKTITLPLLSLFYGPRTYPSLLPFPGCSPPNPSQSNRAPGLLNCTSLGADVQSCQDAGIRVLLSLHGSSAGAVGGNLDYGAPGASDYPYGPYYAAEGMNASAMVSVERVPRPNLFDSEHAPSAFAATVFGLFGEGTTERADLRPLGPDGEGDGVRWFAKPLGEEVVVDGFDVHVPGEWKGTWQGNQFEEFEERLRELIDESWKVGGGKAGGAGDVGSKGKGVVLTSWV